MGYNGPPSMAHGFGRGGSAPRCAGRRLSFQVLMLCAALASTAALSASAAAQSKIGVAAIVKNDVTQVGAGRAEPISPGEDVVRDETVRTGGDSNAKLVFVDDTNLAVGPISTVRLDKFVFEGASTYNQVGIELAKGAFRFTTGHSEKRAYDIKTPVATIGVRGTIVDILSQLGRTTVRLQEGRAIVCPRRVPRDTHKRGCIELNNSGDTAVVTAAGARSSLPGWSFEASCKNDLSGLCGATTYASLAVTDATLCGR